MVLYCVESVKNKEAVDLAKQTRQLQNSLFTLREKKRTRVNTEKGRHSQFYS